jgi:lysophospholipase L1-like esterase
MLTLLLSLVALTSCRDQGGGAVTSTSVGLAVGDSILAWNRDEGASIPDVVAADLGIEISNAAEGGATMLGDEDDIPSQYVSRAWELLIVDGGGNDIGDDCNAILDSLVAPDVSSGVLVSLIDRAQGDGTRLVVLMGYYAIPPEAGSFACPAEFEALDARYAAFAESRDGVIFVDPGDAVDASDASYYDVDLVHPSIKGSEAVGRLIAARAREAQAGDGG